MSACRESLLSPVSLLTLSRIPLAAALWIAPESPAALLGLTAAAGLSDVLDGKLARWWRARLLRRGDSPGTLASPQGMGAWLDPLCDKIFIVSLVAVGWVSRSPPWSLILLIAVRELLLPLLLAYRPLRRNRRVDLRAGLFGKATTAAQFAAVAALILRSSAAMPLAVVAAACGVLAAGAYLQRGLRVAAAPDRRLARGSPPLPLALRAARQGVE